ncbi:MAG: nucleotidyl transferase AbiEii/AbiGii toxin family protein [Pirellulaceae bacterium]
MKPALVSDESTTTPLVLADIVPYERRLAASISYVLDEGGRLFMGESEVNKTLRRISKRLNELSIPYGVAGGMALIAHGFRRFTEDIDILVTQDGLDQIHAHLDGLGWIRPYSISKNLRDTENGVRVEFLVAGGFPGDGLPKPVSFPAPSPSVVEDHEGIAYVNLPTFVALKLASGMTNSQRGKDLTDVEELIRAIPLARDFSDQLDPYVREKYQQLWQRQQVSTSRFYVAWDCPALQVTPQSLADLLAVDTSEQLQSMAAEGIEVAAELSSIGQAILFTHDRSIAAKYGMRDQFEVDLKKLRQHPANG